MACLLEKSDSKTGKVVSNFMFGKFSSHVGATCYVKACPPPPPPPAPVTIVISKPMIHFGKGRKLQGTTFLPGKFSFGKAAPAPARIYAKCAWSVCKPKPKPVVVKTVVVSKPSIVFTKGH